MCLACQKKGQKQKYLTFCLSLFFWTFASISFCIYLEISWKTFIFSILDVPVLKGVMNLCVRLLLLSSKFSNLCLWSLSCRHGGNVCSPKTSRKLQDSWFWENKTKSCLHGGTSKANF